MNRISKLATLGLASAALVVGSPAQAQVSDLDPAEVSAATRYALPHAFDGFMTSCFDSLAPDGYAVTNADRLRVKFADGAEASWPGAKDLMMSMAREEAGEMSTLLEMMEDDDLRPFVDGLITSLVASEIPTDDCEMIERGLEILDPMPADNVAMMVGFIIELGISMEEDEIQAAANTGEPEMTESRARKLREQEEARGQ